MDDGERGGMRNFRELLVWQKAHEFVLALYRLTEKFPPVERFRLTDQLLRAGISIPNNIAEGVSRAGDAETAQFLNIAIGSTGECEYLLLLACDLGYITAAERDVHSQAAVETRKMLFSWRSKLLAARG